MVTAVLLRQMGDIDGESLKLSNTSITITLKCGGRLCVEADGGQLFELFYFSANHQNTKVSRLGEIRRKVLEKALPILPLNTAIIPTKIGNLVVSDYKQIKRLREFLDASPKK